MRYILKGFEIKSGKITELYIYVSIRVNLIDIIICPDIRIISKKNLGWSDSAPAVR